MMKLSDDPSLQPIQLDSSILGEREKLLWYGPPGSGKTFASGTAPAPIFYIVLGGPNELKSLVSPDFVRKYPDAGPFYHTAVKENLGKHGSFVEAKAYDLACDALDIALAKDESGEMPFKTLVVDSATGLRGVAMNKAMEITYDMAKSKEKQALTRLREYGVIKPGDTDFGSEQSLIWKFINWCYELDKHFILITHEWQEVKKNRETRIDEILAIKPSFTGKHRTDVPLMFDNVWRFTPSGGERARQFEAQTVGDDIIMAKTRVGGVLPIIYRDVNVTDAISQMKNWEVELKKREEIKKKRKK